MNELFRIFGWKELQSIAGGRRLTGLSWLLFISFGALFSLSLAHSVQEFLRSEMDDPFVRLVEVNWPHECTNYAINPASQFGDFVGNKFAVKKVRGMYNFNYDFASNIPGNDAMSAVVSVVRQSDIVFELLMSDDAFFIEGDRTTLSLLKKRKSLGARLSSAEGVIVTKSYLKSVGLGLDAESISMEMGNGFAALPLPIAAIVSQLPSEIDVLIHSALHDGIARKRGEASNSPVRWSIEIQEAQESNFHFSDDEWNEITKNLKRNFYNVRPAPHHAGGIVATWNPQNPVLPQFKSSAWISPAKVLNMTISDVSDSTRFRGDPSIIGVMFSEIDSVREFASFIGNSDNSRQLGCDSDLALKVDLSKVKAKESITLFNKIALLLQAVLILATSLLLIFRCNALFELHIEKNRASLGTLKAFGLSNRKIIGVYASIAFVMLLTAFVLSVAFLSLVGPISLEVLKSSMEIRIEDSMDLQYQSFNLLICMIAFVIIPICVVSLKIHSLLRLSPGALVFHRKSTAQ